MNPIFVDSAFVIALINRRDQYHQEALRLASRFAGHPLLTTDAILLELGNALARSYKQEAIQVIEQFQTAPEVEIVNLTPQLFEAALRRYKVYMDKHWSLVDCISFTVMENAGTTQALTPDQHFVQAGFQILMR